mgnify:CR=1 FL=1
MLTFNKTELEIYVKNRKLTEGHLETLSEYFKEVGIAKTETNKIEAQLYLAKAVELLEIADEVSKTMSIDRINKSSEIKNYFNI